MPISRLQLGMKAVLAGALNRLSGRFCHPTATVSATNGDSAAIIRAIAELGSSLGIETTAEGIETPEQLELVRRAGCTEAQGFLLSPPRPAADMLDLIARLRGDVAAA